MATKKTRRPKKKKPIQRPEPITLFTKTDDILDQVFIYDERETLYHKASILELQQILSSYQILLSPEQVLKDYQKCFNFENLINSYYKKYEQEFALIESQSIVLNEDILFEYMDKIIKKNFKIIDLPDPDFIDNAFDALYQLKKSKKGTYFLSILKNINQIRNYTDEKNLSEIFESTLMDIEKNLKDEMELLIYDIQPDYQTSKSIVDEMWNLLEYYELKDPALLYSYSTHLLAIYGYNKVEEKFKYCLKKFPEYQKMIYMGVIYGLNFHYIRQHIQERDIVLQLTKEAINLPCTAFEDNVINEQLKTFFEFNFPNETIK